MLLFKTNNKLLDILWERNEFLSKSGTTKNIVNSSKLKGIVSAAETKQYFKCVMQVERKKLDS